MTTNYYFYKEQFLKIKEAWSQSAQELALNASHHMLYNIIRGKDPQYGFTPFQRPSKFYGQGTINLGAYLAYQDLKWHASNAAIAIKRIDQGKDPSEYDLGNINRFLKVFKGTINLEDLADLEIPEVEPVWTVYGKGKALAERIEAGEIQPKTCIELMELYYADSEVRKGIRVDTKEEAA